MEVMEEAMEPFSQSLSMFLLDARLRPGMDSMEHTEPALEDMSVISQLIAVHLSHVLMVPDGQNKLLPLRLRPSGDDTVRLSRQRERRSQMTAAEVG